MAFCAHRLGGLARSRRKVRSLDGPVVELPTFLCPAIARRSFHVRSSAAPARSQPPAGRISRRCIHVASHGDVTARVLGLDFSRAGRLPLQCAGCGALSQTVDKGAPGYYCLDWKSVRAYLGEGENEHKSQHTLNVLEGLEDGIHDSPVLKGSPSKSQTPEPPLCERCHNLKHHHKGESISHPSIRSLEDTIAESPHKYNHIYHVVDAVDFPMSLIPGIHKLLNATPQRSQNRRSKTDKFYHGKQSELSFVITRSDLLAPLKTQVDAMMPYLTDVLRDALGRAGKDVRLGNVRCVSAKREWWTGQLKEDIWARGGSAWMVGKVNVGKSRLFHCVFPKGRSSLAGSAKSSAETIPRSSSIEDASLGRPAFEVKNEALTEQALNPDSLLPPPQAETDYPFMPLVSSLPGTTASPIRIPFGRGKGELIDLPGLSRGDLELFVQPEHRPSLVMRSRVSPSQQVIKATQSLLLGGFIRITPTDPDVVILAYAFTPIEAHLTATDKAVGTQTQTRESALTNIALPGVGDTIASAGIFPLRWDVTRKRTGPVTAPDGAHIKLERLPYRVLSTDLLIEGCGWVELVAQVRKRPGEMEMETDRGADQGEHSSWPAVEVFTPEGRFVSARAPMGAWALALKKPGQSSVKSRPRRSMKGAKKSAKLIAAYMNTPM